jgi:hypothetical protein
MKQKPMKHKNLIIAAAVAVVAGVGIYWYSISSEPKTGPVNITTGHNGGEQVNNSNTPTNNAIPAGDPSQVKGKNLINLGPQSPGNSLIVDLVNLVKPGYIAIYQANSKGQAGNLVAVSPLIKAGTSEDLVVKVPLKASTTYVVSLRNDDGDGKFNAAKDAILNDVTGKPVVQNITTSKK